MEGEGWRQVLAKASEREWKMMSLGVGRLFLASILAKNTTIWPQLQGVFALSPPSDHLWASPLALQTSAFLLLNAGREPKLADAPSGGGEQIGRAHV